MVAVAMIAIAISGIFWGLKMRRLSRSFALKARINKQSETSCRQFEAWSRDTAEAWKGFQRLRGDPANLDPSIPKDDRLREREERNATAMRKAEADWGNKADHYAAMYRKYDRAARYPWLTVEPDLPEPK
jgi:hypothetical protein